MFPSFVATSVCYNYHLFEGKQKHMGGHDRHKLELSYRDRQKMNFFLNQLIWTLRVNNADLGLRHLACNVYQSVAYKQTDSSKIVRVVSFTNLV